MDVENGWSIQYGKDKDKDKDNPPEPPKPPKPPEDRPVG